MKRKLHHLFAIVMMCVMLLGLVGCGGTEGADSDGPDNAAGTETAEVTDKEAGTEAAAITDVGSESASSEEAQYMIKGADISSLQAVEDNGGVFYDFDGNEVDAIEFLMENGCNYFRLRIWNNPTTSFDAGDYCDLDHTLEMAKRIKDAGGEYLLDFHYSDTWADPNNQTIPSEWADLSEDELVQAVYDYTYEVLSALAEEDAYPDMVQIGNEIGNGMLWPYGSTENPETLAALLNSGISAVRDTQPQEQDTLIMIHVETGGAKGTTEEFFSTIEEYGVTDYDIVGLSYYPYWQGTTQDLKSNIENIYEKFGKQVVLAETAYPFTTDNADDKQNMVSDAECADVGFDASEENQRLVLELIMNTVSSCDGGLGLFYWEPTWIAVDGVGSVQGGGNEWENQALFDFDGNALEAIKAFSFVPGSLDNDEPLLVYDMEEVEVDETAAGDDLLAEFPETAKVLYQDGSIRDAVVEWDLSSEKVITDTRKAYKGTVLGELTVNLPVILVDRSTLSNLDFEEGDTGWVIEQTRSNSGYIATSDTGTPYSGDWCFQYWDEEDFEINLYQKTTVSETAEYHLSVWSQGVGDTGLVMTLYIADAQGNLLASTEFTNDGWAEWQHPVVSAELTEGDSVRIGVILSGTARDWGTLDDFEFYTGELKVDETSESDTEEGGNAGLNVSEGQNLLQNSSFENQDTGWTITQDNPSAGSIRNDSESYPYSGAYSFHYWNATDFFIDVAQEVTISESGSYAVGCYSQGDAETETTLTLYVKDADGNLLASTEFGNEGWSVWQAPLIEGIELESGQTVTVGVEINGVAEGWGTLDDFYLVLQ